jgi:hypothetical protein
VIEDAKVVGRIYEDRYVPADVKWSITEYMQFGMQTNNPSHSRLASGLIQEKAAAVRAEGGCCYRNFMSTGEGIGLLT